MTFSNDNQEWSDLEPFSNTKVWNLSPGEGNKTVFVQFRDTAGNWMIQPAYDQIVLEESQTLFWPIAYNKMWGTKKNENLLLLRVFRDEILRNTVVGRECIFLLYDNSLEIATLLLKEPSLTLKTREVIDELLLSVESLLHNDEMEISQDTIDNFVTLLDQFETKASPKLKTTINKVRREIDKGKILKQLEISVSE